MTHGRGISPPHRRRGNGQRLQALLLLLAMCLAVVPHATVAASLMQPHRVASSGHEAQPSGTAPTAMEASAEAAPCHRPEAQSREHPASAAPPCCVLGCSLIAEVPAIALPARGILWTRPTLAMAEPLAGISPEPAKKPPRTGPALG